MAEGVDIAPFTKGLAEYQAKVEAAIKEGVYQFASAVLTRAKELCPVKTGFLVNSGELGDLLIESGVISITIGFNAAYAAAVHEILTNHHLQGQAKFLENAMNEFAPKFNDFIRARIAQVTA